MKNIKDLEKRAWFRAIKVVYIFLFLISLFAVFYFTYEATPKEVYDYDKSYIVCNSGKGNGNSYPLNKNSIFTYDAELSDYNAKDARKLCAYNKINVSYDEYSYPDPGVTNYTYFPLYKTEGSWWSAIKDLMIGLAVVSFAFWLIRGIFYYVVLGSFSGHKADLD